MRISRKGANDETALDFENRERTDLSWLFRKYLYKN
jgi:hypothetical protein